jgi:CelD/BcsL family acetyltransferase involved in cellulose biosynthesis
VTPLVHDRFGAPAVAAAWRTAMGRPATDTVFQTLEFQLAWWEALGTGDLAIVQGGGSGEPVLMPLFITGGMGFPIGSGTADYMDLIGRASPGTLAAMLGAVAAAVPGFVGFRFHHLPRESPTTAALDGAARALGWEIHEETWQSAPFLDLAADPEAAERSTRKKSLVRRENYLRREGDLEVRHLSAAVDVAPHLDAFFDQHVRRWDAAGVPSLFVEPAQRAFYHRLVEAGSRAGWLRFTSIHWNGDPIAFHFGFHHAGRFMWYKPTYEIDLARMSPGQVLLRQLLVQAIAEGATEFDFGIGDETFKERWATGRRVVADWGLYLP